MPIITDGPTMAPEDKGISEFHSGMSESLGAAASEALSDLPTRQLYGLLSKPITDDNFAPSQTDALGNIVPNGPGIAEEAKPATAPVDIIDANDRVKKAGLAPFLKLPDQPDIPPAQLEIMMTRAQQRRERDATMERGPQGFVPSALSVGTSFLVGAVDPVNVAAAFIPVMGEMRYGKMLADAGESAASRFAVRASVGAAQGAVGQAALEPLDWWQHTQDGRDFGMADVLHNVMFGAALGGALHSGGGMVSDIIRRRQGRALYPFGPGEPMENVQGTHLPAALLHEDGVTPEALEQHFGGETPEAATELATPQRVPLRDPVVEPESPGQSIEATAASDATPSPEVQTINDLPARAHEDAMRGAIANLIDGEPVRAGEILEAASQTDPRIAESFEAFHGSPHDFDAFELSKIGLGEGSQSYGHGLYFAQNEKTARSYQRSVSDKVFVDKVAQLYDEHFSPDEAWAEMKEHWSEFSPTEQRLVDALHNDDWLGFDYPHQAVSAALSPRAAERWEMSPETIAAARAMGNMYRVRISSNAAHFLDWDKPLSEQSQQVRDALLSHPDPSISGTAEKWGHSIASLYGRLRQHLAEGERYEIGAAKTSQMLHDAGIPGIKYLDQMSRGTGDGTRNFVLFNDKHIEITHKNGEPVQREQFLADRAAEREGIKTTHVAPKAARGRAAADPKTWSLFEFLAHEGGLKPDPELEAILGNKRGPFVPGFGALIRTKGRALDDALRLAKDQGYLFDAAGVTGAEASLTPRDLLDRIAEERAGRKQYRMDHANEPKVDAEREAHQIISALQDEVEATSGQKGIEIDPQLRDRVVEIVQKEGERDVLAAFERAIMEDAERYEGRANARQENPELADIPGWDAPDARAAPRDGEAGVGEGRDTGQSVQGTGPADGGQSRITGNGDRAAVGNALDRDAAWRTLAHRTPDFDDPNLIAASNEAASVRPPPTKLDDRVAASEKADAFAKKMYDMFAERLQPEDRQRLDDLLKKIDDDHEAREIAIVRGGSCLFGVA